MENVDVKSPIESENTSLNYKTPPQEKKTTQNSIIECPKASTPDRLSVPKAFKYPERYNSPTDLMMSPISKGLLARTRKGIPMLPPTRTLPKIQDLCVPDMAILQIRDVNAGECEDKSDGSFLLTRV